MKLPALVDYRDAVQVPGHAFQDDVLRQSSPQCTPLGLPVVASGGFALTFKVKVGSEYFAVRCFHKEGNHLQQRYARIADFIRTNDRLDFLVDVNYMPTGIRVRDQRFPIVRMPWINGLPLSHWIDDHLDAPASLGATRRRIREAVATLRQAGVAHGDLQHGNILVGSDQHVHLVDYDGMFLPSLRELGASDQGHRNYQHPGRNDTYDESIDVFAAFVIDLSLAAVQHDRTLWDDFHTGENLVLAAPDFADPQHSEAFARLAAIGPIAEQSRRLMDACIADSALAPDILRGVKPAPRTGRRHRSLRNTPTPIPATRTAELRTRQGDEITVFGRVKSIKVHTVRRKLIININFGDYRRADFTIVAFDRASNELTSRFGADLGQLKGSWVSLTGLLTLYQSKWCADPTPQIELERLRSLRLLDAGQVEQFAAAVRGESVEEPDQEPELAEVPPTETRTAPSRATPRTDPVAQPKPPSAPGNGDLLERLGRLYSSPGFAQRVSPSTPKNPTPAPPSPTRATGPQFQPTTRPPKPPGPVPPQHRVYRLPPNPAVPPRSSQPPPWSGWPSSHDSWSKRTPEGRWQRIRRWLGLD